MSEIGMLEPLFGKYVPGETYALYGVAGVGKTLLTMTEVARLVSEGKRVLWLDSEAGLGFETSTGLWGEWKPKLEARFGLKDLNAGVEYHRFIDYVELIHWLGYGVDIEYGENKLTVQFRGKSKPRDGETVYDGWGRKRDNCLIVLDSMSSVFRLQFGSTLQNFPSRGDATSYLIFALQKLMEKTNSPLIATSHASVNPSNVWQAVGIRGGSTVQYYSKSISYLEKPKKKVLGNFRKLYAVRSPRVPDWGAQEWLKIDGEKGYLHSSAEEAEATVAAAAKKGGGEEDGE